MMKKLFLILMVSITFHSCGMFYNKVPGNIYTQYDQIKNTEIRSYLDNYNASPRSFYFNRMSKEYVYTKGFEKSALSCFIRFTSNNLRTAIATDMFFEIDGIVFELQRPDYQIINGTRIEKETSTIKDANDKNVDIITGVNKHEEFQHEFELILPDAILQSLNNAKEVKFQCYANNKPIIFIYSPFKLQKLQKLIV
jgi:hypothetical protein